MFDLLFKEVHCLFREETLDVGVKNGKIEYVGISGSAPPAAETVEAGGRMLLPGLVESHIHLDKAYLLEQMGREATTLEEAIQITAALKRGYTREDILRRSEKVLAKAVAAGVTHMRCHAEVDPIIGLSSMETMLELKRKWEHVLTLQIVAFPQEGIFKEPGTAGLMREALSAGADAVGGIPYNDLDADKHLDFVFGLAVEFGKPADLHVDFSDDPNQRDILKIVRRTLDCGMQGKVAVAHLTSLGSVSEPEAREIARMIAEAGIAVITLPMTDLYLNGRADKEKIRRGLTPVRLLREEGVRVIVGSNNIRNAFTPFGRGDPLDSARLLAQTAHLGLKADVGLLLDMVTEEAANALEIDGYGIRPGGDADLVLFDAFHPGEVLFEVPGRIGVWKKGRKVASSLVHTELSVFK
ncbi:amidohydrolase family protein [Thermicanus aegyptius]|uniref:amidohydrolase family protein n=1 Tax=Thermicanus aegyptius TaxID=94009 RepID=UPI00040A04A0|nr:amidohydrolase family protein [Thermicanus aegyptius]